MSAKRCGARYVSYLGQPVSLLGTVPLYLMTCGSRIALVRPCATWNVAPRVCDMACTMPRKALPNAMPAIVPALCIFSRAAGSAAPWCTARARLPKMSRTACRARPSVKSLA